MLSFACFYAYSFALAVVYLAKLSVTPFMALGVLVFFSICTEAMTRRWNAEVFEEFLVSVAACTTGSLLLKTV